MIIQAIINLGWDKPVSEEDGIINWYGEQGLSQSTIDDEVTLHRILRKLRKNVVLRLAVRDLGGLADLTEVMTCMTNLAEVTIKFALKYHQSWLSAPSQFGLPKGEGSGKTQKMLVVAMGKLGGNELNVSSDIDLIIAGIFS